jgi:predicted RNA-binding Zn ribbon-like protein
LRDEPLAVALHNTLHARRGAPVDDLADAASAAAWLAAVAERLPTDGTGRRPSRDELVALRAAVREVLHAAVEDRAPTRAAVDALNRASARAPRSAAAAWRRGQPPRPSVRVHATRRADVVLAALATDAIEVVTGPDRERLRICGAPGCVLAFVKDHPRREWCSGACGNRARQARHYQRRHTAGGR